MVTMDYRAVLNGLLALLIFVAPLRAQAPEDAAKFAAAKAAAERAVDARAELLAPGTFEKAQKELDRATRQSERGRSPDKNLARAEALFVSAAEGAEVAAVTLAIPVASREAALAVDADGRAPDLFEDGVDALDRAARQLERDAGNDVSRYADRADTSFRDAELVSIKQIHLTAARESIAEAEADRVANDAPLTMARAQSLLDQATALLEEDRYATDEPDRLAERADYQARHATYLAGQVRAVKARDSSEEQVMLNWEQPLEQLAELLGIDPRFDSGWGPLSAELEARVGALLTRESELQSRLAALQRDLDEANAREQSYQRELQELDTAMATLERQQQEAPAPEPAETREDPCSEAGFAALFSLTEAEVLRENNRLVLRLVGLEFPSGATELPAGAPVLEKLARGLEQCADRRLTIQGHTDSLGDADSNRRLSQARAEALRRFVIERLSYNPDLINAIGLGESRPIAANETSAGRTRNRRTEVVIWPPQG